MTEIYKFPHMRSVLNEFIGHWTITIRHRSCGGLGERIGVKADITTAPAFLILGR